MNTAVSRYMELQLQGTLTLESNFGIDPLKDSENLSQLEDFDGDNCDGRFAYATIHSYLDCGVYPKDFSKSDKLALRKRAKYFCTKDGDLYYVGGSSS